MKKKLIFSILSMVFLLSSPVTANSETDQFGNNIYQENITTDSPEDSDLFHAQLKITQSEAQGLANGEKLIYYKWNDGYSVGKWQIIDVNNVEVVENFAVDINHPLVYVSSDHVNWFRETDDDRYIVLTKNAVGSFSEYARNYENIIAKARNSDNNYDIGIKATQEDGYQIVYRDDSNDNYCWGDGQPLQNESLLPDVFLSCNGIAEAIESLDAGKPYLLLEKSHELLLTYGEEKELYECKNNWLSNSYLYSELRVVTLSENDNNKFYINKSDGSILTYARNISDKIPPDSVSGVIEINNNNMSDISVEFVPDAVTATTSETVVSSTTTTTNSVSLATTVTSSDSVTTTTTTTSSDSATTTTTTTTVSYATTTAEIYETTTVYTSVIYEEISTEEILTTVITPEAYTSDEENMNDSYNIIVKIMYILSAVISISFLVRIILRNKE